MSSNRKNLKKPKFPKEYKKNDKSRVFEKPDKLKFQNSGKPLIFEKKNTLKFLALFFKESAPHFK